MRDHRRSSFGGFALAVLLSAVVLGTGVTNFNFGAASAAKRGTVTFAEQPGNIPNYINPMQSAVYLNFTNASQFSFMMWIPLYETPAGKPGIDENLSIGEPPVYSDNNTVVTVTMKHWIWSNGRPITARDVILWMNMLSAVSDPLVPAIGSSSAPGPGWGEAVPGLFPQNVVSYTQTGTYSVVFHLNASYDPTWYTDNELTQIWPVPTASWDKLTSASPVGNYDASAEPRELLPSGTNPPCPGCYVPVNPGTATSGALGVAQFINSESQDVSTFATNPIWQVVSGSVLLKKYTSSGYVEFVPNPRFSGRPKATVTLKEFPFTSDAAEFNALRSGSLTIGYIPAGDFNQKATLEKEDKYSFNPWYFFGINVLPYNFTNPTVGPIFEQLYFRKALQSLINQPEYIKEFASGVGTISNGFVPTFPANNKDASSLETTGQLDPYKPALAVRLLKAHGWSVHPGGTTVCSNPGSGADQCGAGIKLNQPATFNMLYAAGSAELENEIEAMQSAMKSRAGITLSLSSVPTPEVYGRIYTACTFAAPCPGWEIADYGTGVTQSYPGGIATGETLFSLQADNVGDYQNSTNDTNLQATYDSPTQAGEFRALYKYENYIDGQLPYMLLPFGPYQLTMYKTALKGLLPQDMYGGLFPEYFRIGAS